MSFCGFLYILNSILAQAKTMHSSSGIVPTISRFWRMLVSAIAKFWSFVTRPEYANAITAMATVIASLSAVATVRYTSITISQSIENQRKQVEAARPFFQINGPYLQGSNSGAEIKIGMSLTNRGINAANSVSGKIFLFSDVGVSNVFGEYEIDLVNDVVANEAINIERVVMLRNDLSYLAAIILEYKDPALSKGYSQTSFFYWPKVRFGDFQKSPSERYIWNIAETEQAKLICALQNHEVVNRCPERYRK